MSLFSIIFLDFIYGFQILNFIEETYHDMYQKALLTLVFAPNFYGEDPFIGIGFLYFFNFHIHFRRDKKTNKLKIEFERIYD